MRSPNKREVVLLSLLAVVAVGVLYFGKGNLLTGGTRPADEQARELGEAPVVHLARLDREVETFDPNARDLFKYGAPPRRAAPVQQVVDTPKQVVPTPPPPRPRVERPTVITPKAQGPRPPKPAFSYLGFLGPKENRIFVFSAGDELMLARVGEVVQEEFKVVEFKYEAVVMGYTDDRFADMTTELTWNR